NGLKMEPTSNAVYFVKGTDTEPSALAIQILTATSATSLPSSLRFDRNASLVPSGENVACVLEAAVNRVIGLRPEPSLFMTQMLKPPPASLPSRAPLEVNAILLPSGDHTG